jgi:hypothetical protein
LVGDVETENLGVAGSIPAQATLTTIAFHLSGGDYGINPRFILAPTDLNNKSVQGWRK